MASQNVIDAVKILYPECKKLASKINPIFATSQAGLESAWLKAKEGDFGLFGEKAGINWKGKKVLCSTTEIAIGDNSLALMKKQLPEIISIRKLDNGHYKIACKDYFRDFDSIEECLQEHFHMLLTSANFAPALKYVADPIAYVTALQNKAVCKMSYATGEDYVKSMTAIINEVESIVKELNL